MATTAPYESPWHSWVVVASGGMSIGHKGMLFASKSLESWLIYLKRTITKRHKRRFYKEKERKFAMLPDGPPPVPKHKYFKN
jgi:aminobenzoyl-glutamate utilization protein B